MLPIPRWLSVLQFLRLATPAGLDLPVWLLVSSAVMAAVRPGLWSLLSFVTAGGIWAFGVYSGREDGLSAEVAAVKASLARLTNRG